MTRDYVNNLGKEFHKLRKRMDSILLVSFESQPACPETLEPSFVVTVTDGVRTSSAHALYLYDAMYMARAKLQEAIAESSIEAVTVEHVPTPSVPKITIDPSKLKVPGK
jgi:hypothetical protein